MPKSVVPELRLLSQRLAPGAQRTPWEIVQAMGAIQAQDYGNALWAIGCRGTGSSVAGIEQAIADRQIVRTWPMRRTLHFIPAEDVRWMLKLLTPRMIAAAAGRMHQLELTDGIIREAGEILRKQLEDKPPQTREAVMALLEKGGVRTDSQRGIHIVVRLAMEGLLCGGPRAAKQQTFVLLDEWVPSTQSRSPDQEESLALLAKRFFGGHGPATLQDFVWWSGLKVSDARRALASIIKELECYEEDGADYWHASGLQPVSSQSSAAHLLPGFDEYLLGYQDRRHVLDAAHAGKVVPGGNGMFLPMMVRGGKIVGTWKRGAVTKAHTKLILKPFAARLTKVEGREFGAAAERYGEFLGVKIALVMNE